LVLCKPLRVKFIRCFSVGVENAENENAVSRKMDVKIDLVFNVFGFKWGKFNIFGGILNVNGV